jgi:thymidylate synthase (FAD)
MNIADISVEYMDHLGNDLTVVNAARVSFDKEHDEFDHTTDRGLIRYLAKHNHWSPFAHCSATFRVKAPIFVARQLVKHTVGFSWNEVSRRYVDSEPEFYIPDGYRARAENVKQGSSDSFVVFLSDPVQRASAAALTEYNMLLERGVCPEQARMVLPQNTMTEWIWTGTLYAWARMCQLRLDSHTQKETRGVAAEISSTMAHLFPTSWEFLMTKDEPKEKVCALLSSMPTSSLTKRQQ